MKSASQESLDAGDGVQSSARLILDVARAASHLELAEVLESLIAALKPTINFNAVAVFVIEGEYARLHSLHVEGIDRKAGEPVESVLARVAARSKMPAPKESVKQRLSDHHVSAVASSRRPFVCRDLQREQLFPRDEKLLQYGVQSYISLPLIKRDEVIGAVDFVSFEKRAFDDSEVQLLQDVLEIVSIAVSNALAYEEITALKEQLQAENRLLQDEIVQRSIYEEIVGSSQSLRNVLGAIDKVAPTDSTVLITGETGTGKELVAHAIHKRSPRSGRARRMNLADLADVRPRDCEVFGADRGPLLATLLQRAAEWLGGGAGAPPGERERHRRRRLHRLRRLRQHGRVPRPRHDSRRN